MFCPRPVICPPRFVVRDCFIPRVVPFIHPVVHINRHNIVNVPRHIFRPITRNVVVDPGYPTHCC
ncbi:hypothetical protein BV455_00561 [Parageobacillus caldoxylosilyticus]|jgi:hypothetical protein|nr:spore coat protein D [Parageobacillus caldoxylosilyticus]OQO98431.1 hypothetical protein BSK33_17390 [Geobacillus sp. 44B]QXJ37299.1 hypothetical protein BV455_00561 [Parageobacillus caldoxylosilyticus]